LGCDSALPPLEILQTRLKERGRRGRRRGRRDKRRRRRRRPKENTQVPVKAAYLPPHAQQPPS